MTSPAPNKTRAPHRAWSPDKDGATGTRDSVRPQRILRVLRARAWLVTLAAFGGLAGGTAYESKRLPVYESTAALVIDPREVQGVAGSAAPCVANADADAAIADAMRVLRSDSLLGALVDKEHLVDDPAFVTRPSPLTELLRILDETLGHASPPAGALEARQQVLDTLDAAVAVAVRRASGSCTVDVSVRTADAATSARLANALVALYIAQAATAAADRDRGDALQDRLTELGARLRDADDRVAQFRNANHLNEGEGALASDQRLRAMTDELTLARAREDEDRAKADKIGRLHRAIAIDSVPEAAQSPAVAQLAEAVRKRAALARELGPRHPDMIAAAQQVQTAQRRLEGELQRLGQAARSRSRRSRAKAATLRESIDTLSAANLNNSAAVTRLRALEQEAETARALFTAVLSRSRELSDKPDALTGSILQIGTAWPARSSATLPGPVILAVSLLLGLTFGTLLAGLLEAPTPVGPRTGQPWPER